jgi:hypothetical protein
LILTFGRLLVALLLVPGAVFSQNKGPARAPVPVNATSKKSATDPESERAAKERRAQVRSLLISLASDARTFSDDVLRARSLARIGDALWEVDQEESRTLFRKSWDAATLADKEGKRRLDEEIRRQKAKTGGGFATMLPPNLRGEVLRLAAKRSRALGEEFLEKLKTDKNEELTEATNNSKRNPYDLEDSLRERLNLAEQLLDNGDVQLATQFADPALTIVSMQGLSFLSSLRQKDITAADTRYNSMLAFAGGNPQSDANTVSYLSSYLFTPYLFITFSGSGTSTSQRSDSITSPETSPELRAAFFRVATQILMRPSPPPDQDQTSAGIEGKYLVIKRLLPLYDQYAPKETADLMRVQLETLAPAIRESVRQRDDDEWVRKSIVPDKSPADRERTLLDRIERAKNSVERDALYIQLTQLFLERGDVRAREFASKVEDSEVRESFRAYVDASLVMNAIDKKKPDEALELARTGELTHIQKAWALTQSAKLLEKTDRDKALSLLPDAVEEAGRIDVSDTNRPRALFGVANAFLVLEPGKAWDATFDAVKAANSAEGFTGEDGGLTLQFQSKSGSSVRSSDVPDFDLKGIFSALAKLDYARSVELARGFQREAPRAIAVISIAQAVLKEKPSPTRTVK